ncbi:MAG: glycoside hydrolase family 127 protein [Pirellulales bacterium]|nr:glycoside hydrolase family 127 protein [Pirellulales bacterium]
MRVSLGATPWLLCTWAAVQALAAPVVAAAVDYPIRPAPFQDVTINGGFWLPRLEANRRTTVRYDFQKCEDTGRIANFAKAAGLETGKFQGICYDDSDVFKVIEGASYTLAVSPDPQLDAYLDGLIAKIAAAQEPDGYLYTARTLGATGFMTGRERWSNLRVSHELYNVGHLYEAAVAHWQATGKRTLLDVAIKSADLVARTFGPGEGQRVDVPGHEEIEIGLVKLYRATGEPRYLSTARFFVDARGRKQGRRGLYGPYAQDHEPITDQALAVGHAVRAGYFYAGVADVAALTGEAAYIRAIDRLWEDIVARKLYLTGGLGARAEGEAFGEAYELPNATAYNETCAAIANALFQQRLFLLHGDAKYIDVLERVLYNGFLAGVSLSGDRFFYPNPLASAGDARKEWFTTSCCPVNVVRFLPSLAGFAYASRDDHLFVNLFLDSRARLPLGDRTVELVQRTEYPWSERVCIEILPTDGADASFALHVRIPGWAQGHPVPSNLYRYLDDTPVGWSLAVNGQAVEHRLEQGFAVVQRAWRQGDRVELELPMPVRRVVAHERVADDQGRLAVERGPVVYCAEAVDQPDRKVAHVVVPDDAEFSIEHRPDLLGGVDVLSAAVRAAHRAADGTTEIRPAVLTAIPYYAWAHRERGEMAVWLARDPGVARPLPAATLASRAAASASHTWQRDTTAALNDQVEPSKSADDQIARFTWWDHRGSQEWVQYDLAATSAVARAAVYWFDDTGTGHCKVPASWRLVYRDGDAWRPVELQAGSAYATAVDRYNEIQFAPVETNAVRLEVQLQDGMSAGILEWRLE